MRLPLSVFDKALLEDEPFSSGFLALGFGDSRRSRKPEIKSFLNDMAARLKDDEIFAADAWIRLAFKGCSSECKKRRVRTNLKTRRVFVEFYWNLSKHNLDRKEDSAANFLRQELSSRGYDYAPVETKGTKREVLDIKHRHRSIGTSGAGFKGAQVVSDRFSSPLKVDDILQTKSSTSISHSPVALSPQGARVRITSELLESPRQPAILSLYEKCSAVSDSTDLPPPVMDVCAAPIQENKPTVHHEKNSIAMPSPDMLSEKMNIDVLSSSQNSSSRLVDGFRPEIMPGTALEGDISTPHILVPSAAYEISSDGTLFESQDTFQSSAEEPAHTLTSNILLDETTLRLSIVKPPLPYYPPIWAQSRQEVCESFDWFRSYQGGVYFTNDYVKGYLLSAFSSMHDIFKHDGRLIISHGGGKAESAHSHQGKSITRAADDQLAQDKSVRALLTNYRESRPLVLLIDDKYALFPYDLRSKAITYAVLGFYTISHTWAAIAEYQPAENVQGRVVRYKFAFQWCDGQGQPWWTLPPSEDGSLCLSSTGDQANTLRDVQVESQQWPYVPSAYTDMLGAAQDFPATKITKTRLAVCIPSTTEEVYDTCPTCSQKSPKVYEQSWVCLNPDCSSFWVDSESRCGLPYNLTYDPKFLQLSKPYILPLNLRDIRPTPPEIAQRSIGTTYAFTRGLHCRSCGRLSCRFKWEHWECLNCKRTVELPSKIRAPEEFWNESLPSSFLDHCVQASSEIYKAPSRLFPTESGMAQVQTYVLPDASGCIHHIQATTPRDNGHADTIFKEYQEHALAGTLKFRRWPMRAHKCRGPLLTNYFSQNSGEPYQYVGGTANTVPFRETSGAVIKARDLIQLRVRQALGLNIEFNEVLSAAYMERQKMAFHSDSERGLGPIVAGLSLGSPALMHFRVHHKYLREEEFDNKAIVLTIVLRHGDILVMDGAGIQAKYEHTVIPTNFRIAATARHIAVSTKSESVTHG